MMHRQNNQSGPQGMNYKRSGKGAVGNNMSGTESHSPKGAAKKGRRILESESSRGTTKGLGAPLYRTNISKPRT